MTDDFEARLGTLLRGPDRLPDMAFVARVERARLADEAFAARRRAAWRRFLGEGAATLAVGASFLLLGGVAPDAAAGDVTAFAPSLAAALLIGFWMLVGMRPAPQAAFA